MIRFRIAAMLGVAMALAIPAVGQKQLAGEWEGTLSTPSGDAHLLWHVTAAADGSLTSTFDNPGEGVSGIKVKTLELKDNALTITIDDEVDANGSPITIRGTLAGTLSADGNEISGTWTQTEPDEEPAMDVTLKRVDRAPAAKQ
ncbi:MAG TPA: hypothetical protein VMD29_11035 [Terracidiphilus sp.]|nr:hypothetical protein [Terracidiphilus sp.]